jgi:NurA domain
MLDLAKLLPQFDGINADVVRDDLEAAIERAADALARAAKEPDRLLERLSSAEGLTFWSLGAPVEPIDTVWQLQPFKNGYSAVAVDGSQIMPSHHEVYNCYLINIGKVCLSYDLSHPVIMESVPHLFHSVDDLYPAIDKRRLYVDESFVSLERNLLELSTLRDMALDAQKRALPVVAFVDGSLIQWSLNQMPESYQRRFLQRLNAVYDTFADRKIPLLGYVSQSRSADLINMLRTIECPYEQSDCKRYCSEMSEEDFPCSGIWPVTDRQLFTNILPTGCRGPQLQSGANKAMVLPARHHVVCSYLNVGTEVARIEMPRWLASDRKLSQQAMEITLSQAQKGAGYPITLEEAHNQAVIHGSDRRQFFELVANHLVQLGMPRVRVSPKEAGKRRGIV